LILVVDITTQLIQLAFTGLGLILSAVLIFFGRAALRYLKESFGDPSQIRKMLECIHNVSHLLEQHVADRHAHEDKHD
jgi:hypothetical protein